MRNQTQLLLILVVLAGTTGGLRAQKLSEDKIKWESGRFLDKVNDVTTDAPCYFVSHRKDQIDWVQDNGRVIYEMTVLRATGNLDRLSENGEMRFEVDLDGRGGIVLISMIDGQATITLDFYDWSGGPILNSYEVTTIQTLN